MKCSIEHLLNILLGRTSISDRQDNSIKLLNSNKMRFESKSLNVEARA